MNNIIGSRISWLDSVDSTNDELARQMIGQEFIEHGYTVVANQQKHGKGLGDNRWESEPGKNLTFSFIIQPVFLKADQQFYINMVVSLAVYDVIKSMLLNKPVKIKWPNDIYVENGKIGGILISHAICGNEIIHSIIGIGLNVNQTEFSKFLPNPVSLKQIAGIDFELSEVLNKLMHQLNHHFDSIKNGKYQECRDAYKQALFGYYKWLKFRHAGNIVEARITGVTDVGLLQLESSDKRRIVCDLKELEFLI